MADGDVDGLLAAPAEPLLGRNRDRTGEESVAAIAMPDETPPPPAVAAVPVLVLLCGVLGTVVPRDGDEDEELNALVPVSS